MKRQTIRLEKTTLIGQETPMVTYTIFRALAEKRERQEKRAAFWANFRNNLKFWRRRAVHLPI